MLGRATTFAGVLVVACALALLSAWWLVLHGPMMRGIAIGPWRTSTAAGSAQADMYTRAYIAITALFALNPSEALYFEATRDDAGQPLRARCVYAVEGRPVAASWWSITAYADDNFLIANSANRFSFNMGNLKGGAGGGYRIVAAPVAREGNWLPTGSGNGGFNLLFRLYNPTPEIIANPRAVALPLIRPLGACS